MNFSSNIAMIKDEKINQLIQLEIKKYNSFFGNWEQVKKITLLPEEWTVESGELTPTMKPKRKIINERYQKIIDSMYL